MLVLKGSAGRRSEAWLWDSNLPPSYLCCWSGGQGNVSWKKKKNQDAPKHWRNNNWAIDLAVAGRDPDIIWTLSDFITNLKTVKVELWQASSKYSDVVVVVVSFRGSWGFWTLFLQFYFLDAVESPAPPMAVVYFPRVCFPKVYFLKVYLLKCIFWECVFWKFIF